MRDTLKHAMGSIMVTNANALATQATNEVLVDMLKKCPSGPPTDHHYRPYRRQKATMSVKTLCRSAAEACEVPAEETGPHSVRRPW